MMFAVVNLGLKSIRLCLLDEHAHILFKGSYPLHSVIFGEAVEQNGEEWWRLCGQLFVDAGTAGHALDEIEAITVSASSSCLACVADDGRLLRPIMMVSDRRLETGTEPLMQRRLRWLESVEPENYRQAKYFLSPNDYLVFLLTGVSLTDPLNAEKFGYDSRTGAYVGVRPADVARLPEVRPIGASAGRIKPRIAQMLRLAETTEVVLSSYDAIVSVVGSGALEVGDACDVSGTVTSVRMVMPPGCTARSPTLATQDMPVAGACYVGGSTNLGGGLIEWLKTTFYEGVQRPYEIIDAEVQSVPAAHSWLVFLPYLLGERAPLWNPDARGVFFGLERTHGRRHFARATVEGAAFLGLSLIEEITRVSGRAPKRIRLSGGLSRLAIVNRIKADVYGMPIEVVSEFESTVLGAYLLAFHRRLSGGRPTEELFSRAVRVRDIILPDPEAGAAYREKYAIFRDVYAALKPHFNKRGGNQPTSLKSPDSFLENL